MALAHFGRRLMDSFSAARVAWRQYEAETGSEALARRYAERWSIHAGNAYSSPMMRDLRRAHSQLYHNTSLLWKHSKGVVGFYEDHVYLGGISTDGKPLADGTLGAIPIMPQVQTDEQAQNIRTAFAEMATRWNWEAKKGERPKMAAILGDVLTEIVDDVPRRDVYPQLVWPGYVTHVELDHLDNVRAYTLEYMVQTEDERFAYRKEVDKESFRYFKNDRPWSDPDGHGDAVQPNPYGFVPAIWDRHEPGWDERGFAATDSTRQAVHMINSLLSHGIDHQRKVFFAPLLVKGKVFRPGTTHVDLSRVPKILRGDNEGYYDGSIDAQSFDLLAAAADAGVETMEFDVGKTLEFVQALKDGVLAEEPEGTFYQELRTMGQISGTAAERLLGDSTSRCRRARARYDVQTRKKFQMAMSIGGMRVNNGDWGRPEELTRFQQAFRPFTLESFHRGELDFGIADRPVIIPTERERIETALLKESIRYPETLVEIGAAKTIEEARKIVDARQASEAGQALAAARAFNRGTTIPALDEGE